MLSFVEMILALTYFLTVKVLYTLLKIKCSMRGQSTFDIKYHYVRDIVAQSSTEAEYMAIAEACKESVWLKGLYAELCGDTTCINLFCDNQSAIYLTKDQMFHERTKHIDVKYHYIRDIVS